jgi:hypothetical protein
MPTAGVSSQVIARPAGVLRRTTATEDDQMPGHPVEFEKLDIRQWPGIRQARNWWNRGVSPHVEKNAVACQHARTPVIHPDLERFRREETPRAHDQFSAAGFVLIQVHGDQALDHVALALPHPRHVNRGRARHHPELCRVVNQVCYFCAPDFVLAGQTVDVRAGAADPFPFHDGRPVSQPGHVPGQVLTAFSTAQDEDFITLRLRHVPLRLWTWISS